jgi:IS30 family transposase
VTRSGVARVVAVVAARTSRRRARAVTGVHTRASNSLYVDSRPDDCGLWVDTGRWSLDDSRLASTRASHHRLLTLVTALLRARVGPTRQVGKIESHGTDEGFAPCEGPGVQVHWPQTSVSPL